MTSPSNTYLQNLIIDDKDFVWSYSRINRFNDCKYSWMLKYFENENEDDMFFSQYGSFMHKLYQSFLISGGKLNSSKEAFLLNFSREVSERAPTQKIFESYFLDGLRAADRMGEFWSEIGRCRILGTEYEINFNIGSRRFVGFIDLLLEDKDGGLIVVDHKSRSIKPRSKRKKPTKNDLLIDKYLTQLYLYSCGIQQTFGKLPKELWLNCYRNDSDFLIKEEFDLKKYEEAIKWAEDSIEEIRNTEKWTPTCDSFYCNHLCGLKNKCEYFEIMRGAR